MRIADRLSQAGNEPDAQAIIRICAVMRAGEARLEARADEDRLQAAHG
jgi:methylglyoxal synthase